MIFWQATGKHPGLYLSKETLLPLLNRCPALKATALIWKCSCRPTKETGMTTKRLYLEPLWNVRNSQLIEILTDWTSQRKSNGASMAPWGKLVAMCSQSRATVKGDEFYWGRILRPLMEVRSRTRPSLSGFTALLSNPITLDKDQYLWIASRPESRLKTTALFFGRETSRRFVCLFVSFVFWLFFCLFRFVCLIFVYLYLFVSLFVSHAILYKSWSCHCKCARALIQPWRGATTTTYNHNRILYLFGTIDPHSFRVICTCTWHVHFRGIAWTLWPSNNEHVLQHTTTYA